MKRFTLLAWVVLLMGCSSYQRPQAPFRSHWGHGFDYPDAIYCDKDGREAASIISGQVCVFLEERVCETYETHEQALKRAVILTKCP